MLPLNYNIVSKRTVRGAKSPTEFVIPPFFLGETRTVQIRAYTPSGDPSAPLTLSEVTSAALALTVAGADEADAIELTQWTGLPGTGTGTLEIPVDSPLLSSSQTVVNAVLIAVLIVAGEEIYIESPVVLHRLNYMPTIEPQIPPPSKEITALNFTGLNGAHFETGVVGLAVVLPLGEARIAIWFRVDDETVPDLTELGVTEYRMAPVSGMTDAQVAAEVAQQIGVAAVAMGSAVIVVDEDVGERVDAEDAGSGAAITIIQQGA